MNIEEAAESLHARLRGEPWLTAVGVGEDQGQPCIIVCARRSKVANQAVADNVWSGYPVLIRMMSTPKPARGRHV